MALGKSTRNLAENDNAVWAMLKGPLEQVADYVAQKIWNENRTVILKVVYGAFSPMDYERTSEFRTAAWDTKTTIGNREVTGEMYYKPDEMSSTPPENTQIYMGVHHGVGGWGDARAYLADIIYQGISGPAYGDGPWTRKRDAFSALVKTIGTRKMNKWLVEGFTMVGLPVVSRGSLIQETW